MKGRPVQHGSVLLLLAIFAGEAWAGPRAVISLRDECSAPETIVAIRDVADVRCPDAAVRRRLEAIDLWEFKGPEDIEATIPVGLLQMRLLLAGISLDEVTFTGMDSAHVRLSGNRLAAASRLTPDGKTAMCPLTDLMLEERLTLQIAHRLELSPQDVRLQLTAPCLARALPANVVGTMGILELTVLDRPEPGRVPVGVRVLQDNRVVARLQTQVDLALRLPVLVARQPLVRGTLLDENVVDERLDWVTRNEPRPRKESALGSRVNRDLGEGYLLKMSDFSRKPEVPAASAAEFAVRSRDKVQMTARKGPLVVVLRGAEAQQQGRVGEWISVKNLESNRIVTAKVIGPGEVEIPLQ